MFSRIIFKMTCIIKAFATDSDSRKGYRFWIDSLNVGDYIESIEIINSLKDNYQSKN